MGQLAIVGSRPNVTADGPRTWPVSARRAERGHVPLRGHVEVAVGVEGDGAGDVAVGAADVGVCAVGAYEESGLLSAPSAHGEVAGLDPRRAAGGGQDHDGGEHHPSAHGTMLPPGRA